MLFPAAGVLPGFAVGQQSLARGASLSLDRRSD
jgi:hypothetical protein